MTNPDSPEPRPQDEPNIPPMLTYGSYKESTDPPAKSEPSPTPPEPGTCLNCGRYQDECICARTTPPKQAAGYHNWLMSHDVHPNQGPPPEQADHNARLPGSVRIRFNGDSMRLGPRFVEVEDAETGASIRYGEWERDPESDDWLLVLPNNARLRPAGGEWRITGVAGNGLIRIKRGKGLALYAEDKEDAEEILDLLNTLAQQLERYKAQEREWINDYAGNVSLNLRIDDLTQQLEKAEAERDQAEQAATYWMDQQAKLRRDLFIANDGRAAWQAGSEAKEAKLADAVAELEWLADTAEGYVEGDKGDESLTAELAEVMLDSLGTYARTALARIQGEPAADRRPVD